MKRFQFTLDPALRLRRRREEEAQVALAERQRSLVREEAQLAELRRDLRRHEQARADLQRRALDVSALVDADRYGDALYRALLLQEERVHAAAEAVEAARAQLHRCRVDRETLERLRERRLEDHRREALREEQEALDEAFVLRWKRD
jgi:flagellar FliJ protein